MTQSARDGKTWGIKGESYCSDDAASLEGDGRSDNDNGDDVITSLMHKMGNDKACRTDLGRGYCAGTDGRPLLIINSQISQGPNVGCPVTESRCTIIGEEELRNLSNEI